jgi:hypothetical protein
MLGDDDALALLAKQEGAELTSAQGQIYRALRQLVAVLCGTIFMRLLPELADVVPTRLEDAPTIAQYYAMLRSGALSMQTAKGQAMFGSALLRDALER